MALSDEREPPDVLNALYVLAATVPLAWRRHAPVAVLAALLAAAMLETAFVTPLADISTPFVAVLVAVYATGAHAPAREAIPACCSASRGSPCSRRSSTPSTRATSCSRS